MIKNQSTLHFNGTQITLVNIDLDFSRNLDYPDSKYIESGKYYVNQIKTHRFEYDKTIYVTQGSLSCFGLLITHLGEYPSPFWFEKYKNLSITSISVYEEGDFVLNEFNRNDRFVSRQFPENKCLVNQDDDPFILHLKFIGIEVNCSSIGVPLTFDLHAMPKDFHEKKTVSHDLSSPSQPFSMGGLMVVHQTLKLDGFTKNDLVFLKMQNTDLNMDLEIEDLMINNSKYSTAQFELPYVLNPGNQYNLSIPISEECIERVEGEGEGFIGLLLRWNVHKKGEDKYSLWTNMEMKVEDNKNKSVYISWEITDIHNSKLTLMMNIKVKKKMDLILRVINDRDFTHFNKLVPFHDSVDIGMVKVEEDRTYPLYFYYVAPGLHCSPKMELIDKISEEIYKIERKIFNVSQN